jgi:hypothetical protein
MRGVTRQKEQNRYKVTHPIGDGKYHQLYFQGEKEAILVKLEFCILDKMTPNCRKKKSRASDASDLPTGIRESLRRGKKIFISTFKNYRGKITTRDIIFNTDKERDTAKAKIVKWRLNLIKKDLQALAKKNKVTLKEIDW